MQNSCRLSLIYHRHLYLTHPTTFYRCCEVERKNRLIVGQLLVFVRHSQNIGILGIVDNLHVKNLTLNFISQTM